ncbi:MAG: GNAT family N-acetyltransferase [Candidatus Eremiobacteraeota bacterium]|nr:GNAT family N-acetyltransferase [Candidatus Eremiobacteraeota bacterium]
MNSIDKSGSNLSPLQELVGDEITIRKGRPEDAENFSQLFLMTGEEFLPALFGPKVKKLMSSLFKYPNNYFSFENSSFLILDNQIAGMALVFDYQQKNSWFVFVRTFFLFIRYLGWDIFSQLSPLLRSDNIIAKIQANDLYLSNIAVSPDFRGQGLGTKLLNVVSSIAKSRGCKRIVLDVETEKKGAIRLYQKFGYRITKKSDFPIGNHIFHFYHMILDLEVKSTPKTLPKPEHKIIKSEDSKIVDHGDSVDTGKVKGIPKNPKYK